MMRPIKGVRLSIEALWREVLLQALTDGLNSPPVSDPILGAGAEIPPSRSSCACPTPARPGRSSRGTSAPTATSAPSGAKGGSSSCASC